MSPAFPGNPFRPARRATREVRVGDVGIGGANPIRVQSMTTTDTRDVAATAAQVERLADVGCEIVRVTVPSLRDADALEALRAELRRRGVRVPLVADIHFTPNAALRAAEWVEKVRVNPGNYADKKRFEVREYGEREYAEELERVAERFRPLVRRCRELGRAMRIGTNHGSLSDRIMNRYGDTPRGMVESALEFLDVCEDEGYRDVVFSMKASNPQVAIAAYRLLAARLAERGPGPSYPFHVGVTEAGGGDEGRVKSAIGIGALLEDGLGDTIRVSLTEDPVKEVPVARALAERAMAAWAAPVAEACAPGAPFTRDPFAYARRPSRPVRLGAAESEAAPLAVGGDAPVRAELDLGGVPADAEDTARALALALARVPELACEGVRVHAARAADLVRAAALARAVAARALGPLTVEVAGETRDALMGSTSRDGGSSPETGEEGHAASSGQLAALPGEVARWALPVSARDSAEALARAAAAVPPAAAVEWRLEGQGAELDAALERALEVGRAMPRVLFSVSAPRLVPAVRRAAARLAEHGVDAPLVLVHRRAPGASDAADLLHAASDLGALLCDGLGDAVVLPVTGGPEGAADALSRAYRILQGARLRTPWTEFISCPSCGRTLFDLEETTARIKARTGHLKGVKIAVMGCIVNGPGEMADADFGYVGSGPGIVNLYVGQQCVERHVPADEADARLVELIRKHGRWVDPA